MPAARSTLEVVQREGLQEKARRVGALVRSGLESIAKEVPCLGYVRGAGPYVGVDIVKDPASKEPDEAAPTAIVNGLRNRGVLISATGAQSNVLKIRPPLVFSSEDCERLLEEVRLVTRGL